MIYASNPNWQNNSGQLLRGKPDADLVLLEAERVTTNNIEVYVDEKRLYINESVQRKIWLYDILPKSKVVNKKLFTHPNNMV
ncbi:MAG: sugar lactone lactonase YvrE [Paraglaciecola sp.]|jgi:sugar lactone lactonase YvrE